MCLLFVENLKANLQDDRFCAGRVREQRRQLAGLGDLRRGPGIGSGILCMGRHRQNARYSQDRDRRIPWRCTSGENFSCSKCTAGDAAPLDGDRNAP